MVEVWNWLSENHGALNAIAAILTLFVWLFYFQVLLSSYRHRLRAKILITRGGGRKIAARCIVTNMSAEAIYVEAIIITMRADQQRFVASLSELDIEQSDAADPRQKYLQGPVSSGEMIDIGSFEDLLSRATNGGPMPGSFTISVIATYTAEETLVAAERDFEVSGQDLISDAIVARQVRSPWQRRRLVRLLEEALTQ